QAGYEDAIVNEDVVARLKAYKEQGFSIILNTSRNMNSYQNNIGLINKNTLPVIINWLDKNDIPYDEIYVGKPWCGHEGFYVDDKAIRPSEFVNKTYEEIVELLGKEK
ncbi:capsular biosynthesis protein, partial [Escherichia coli]|nr:capsular biosynthesis protein [Escherichia coli]